VHKGTVLQASMANVSLRFALAEPMIMKEVVPRTKCGRCCSRTVQAPLSLLIGFGGLGCTVLWSSDGGLHLAGICPALIALQEYAQSVKTLAQARVRKLDLAKLPMVRAWEPAWETDCATENKTDMEICIAKEVVLDKALSFWAFGNTPPSYVQCVLLILEMAESESEFGFPTQNSD